ncbi:hypothetical protein SARC_06636 [Sphaeroforma arctica JP610]|uniref:Uncharacterized protein n=1 Tax=Sphaeroforma arctica JP610 TaxID=667725 RepID=A0A0L0FW12_9EUKA|nr:hypothetical protein SARC_06636 [Sphaeroforma arctica JP610]KNC81022.1 hypothetical protein SARC_06636 [Sphaeroforma arctica JP610]|eukprot:XP_014154924.1 hypothetical protein SARC_06636 [Sphaeroforma arctica JP610]
MLCRLPTLFDYELTESLVSCKNPPKATSSKTTLTPDSSEDDKVEILMAVALPLKAPEGPYKNSKKSKEEVGDEVTKKSKEKKVEKRAEKDSLEEAKQTGT